MARVRAQNLVFDTIIVPHICMLLGCWRQPQGRFAQGFMSRNHLIGLTNDN